MSGHETGSTFRWSQDLKATFHAWQAVVADGLHIACSACLRQEAAEAQTGHRRHTLDLTKPHCQMLWHKASQVTASIFKTGQGKPSHAVKLEHKPCHVTLSSSNTTQTQGYCQPLIQEESRIVSPASLSSLHGLDCRLLWKPRQGSRLLWPQPSMTPGLLPTGKGL